MKSLENLKEILDEQIKKIARKGDINPQELEAMYKAVDIIKDITTIDAMENAEKSNNERGNTWDEMYYNTPMRSYDNGSMNRGGYNTDREHSTRGGSYDNMMSREYSRGYNAGVRETHSRANVGGASNGYSEHYPIINPNMYAYDNSTTSNDYSTRRGRNATGQFTSREMRYSRAEAKDKMIEKLEKMMDSTTSAKEREVIRTAIEELEK